MRKIKNFFITIVMAIMVLFAGLIPFNGLNEKKANALSPSYAGNNYVDTIYYFTDSTPTFGEVLDSYVGLNVIYDIHPLITSQELAYMLYSGYFWGFDQSVNNIVIIEIKTIQPDASMLEELFECLQVQGCQVFFISPYQPEFGDLQYVDESIPCNMDKFSRFLKNSVITMLDENDQLRNCTTIFLDGRFIGLTSVLASYDMAELCASSPVLRRLLLYMYYNCNTDMEIVFEEDLYKAMWQCYKRTYNIQLNYFDGDTDINDYIDMWCAIDESNDDTMSNFRDYYGQEYNAYYEEQVGVYYETILTALRDKDIHILTHVDGTLYIDIMDDITNNLNACSYNFSDYVDVFEEFDVETYYFYYIGIWQLEDEFYDLLLSIQVVMLATEQYPNVSRYPYIWVVDPFIEGEGLVVRLEERMQEIVGTNCEGCPECVEYPQEELDDMFIERLFSLI